MCRRAGGHCWLEFGQPGPEFFELAAPHGAFLGSGGLGNEPGEVEFPGARQQVAHFDAFAQPVAS